VHQKIGAMGFNREDVPRIVENIRKNPLSGVLLPTSPVDPTDELLGKIFEESFETI